MLAPRMIAAVDHCSPLFGARSLPARRRAGKHVPIMVGRRRAAGACESIATADSARIVLNSARQPGQVRRGIRAEVAHRRGAVRRVTALPLCAAWQSPPVRRFAGSRAGARPSLSREYCSPQRGRPQRFRRYEVDTAKVAGRRVLLRFTLSGRHRQAARQLGVVQSALSGGEDAGDQLGPRSRSGLIRVGPS